MKKEEQIDEMINEGLGAGKIDDEKDKKQLDNPLTKKIKKKDEPSKERDNSMVEDFEDAKQLGKEMENMETEKELKKKGKDHSPEQHQ
ncbi:hypothetical protein [Bacillus sp. FJAT-45350]|uniref:hypothetical protein n=1 Tax=Bacillus sp. FJAT-45350 TaxID=2011014 RepID=UPI000BB9778D|nr:hypothetical protein [Bacillus sp. FJAT-45350]